MKTSCYLSTVIPFLHYLPTAYSKNSDLWDIYEDTFKSTKYIDLTHAFEPVQAVWPGFANAEFRAAVAGQKIEGYVEVGEEFTYAKHGFVATAYNLFTDQYGTQLDPPAHWDELGATISDIPATYALRPLVVINIADQVAKDEGYHLQVSDVEVWEEQYGQIPEGSVVMVRSDWHKNWSDTERFAQKPFPGVGLEALKFLHNEREILFHGHEPLDTDTTPTLEGEYWLLHNHYAQAEGVANLDQVPEYGALLSIGFAKPKGGTGGYARYVAIAPEDWEYGVSVIDKPGAPLPKQQYPLERDDNGVMITSIDYSVESYVRVNNYKNSDLWDIYEDTFKSTKYIDLTHAFEPVQAVWPGFANAEFRAAVAGQKIEGYVEVGEEFTYAKHGFVATAYNLFTDQYGTQLDPPAHWDELGATISDIPATYALRPLVVINIADQVAKDEGYHLQVSDVEVWEEQYGQIPEGSVVMVRSDWHKNWSDTERFAQKPFPGVGLEALKFLHNEREILFHGHEPLDTDTTPTLEGEYWLLHNHYAQAEGVANLDQVPEYGALLSIGFAKPKGGTGGYARYVAIAPEDWEYGVSVIDEPGAPLPQQQYPLERDGNGVMITSIEDHASELGSMIGLAALFLLME